ncbi:MAG TPA: branched-chain amino acid ABC transporter permease [Acidimicrobiales bacterium]|nr:branched-chain amino acid ABC transporter permease [Acidimicrobiales bacterium]
MSRLRWQQLGVLAVAAGAVAFAYGAPDSMHFYGALSVAYALVALSVMVLAGWTGQISLCQASFFGVGAYGGQKLLAHGVPLPLTLVLVACIGAAVSLVLGGPSLRLRGVYLTIVTLAFGAACEKFVFPLDSVRGAFAGIVPRASFFGLSTESDRGLYLAGVIVVGLVLLVVMNLRNSDFGRVLFAIRDSEDAAMAMGIRIAPYKIGAFALSSALATTGGVFYAMLFRSTPGASQFGVLQSFFLLALPVIGGLGSLAGGVVGGVLLATAQPIVNLFHVRLFLATGIGLVLIMLARTDGLIGFATRVVADVRDTFTRTAPTPAVPAVPVTPPRVRVRLRTPSAAAAAPQLRLRLRARVGARP